MPTLRTAGSAGSTSPHPSRDPAAPARRSRRSRPRTPRGPGRGRSAGCASTERPGCRPGRRPDDGRSLERVRAGRPRVGGDHHGRPVRRPYSAKSRSACVSQLYRSRWAAWPRRPIASRSVGGQCQEVPDRRRDRRRVGRVDEHPAARLPDDRRHPRQIAGHDRDAGRHRLEQLVRRRQPVVQGRRLDRHRHDVGGGHPLEQLARGDGRQDMEAPAEPWVAGGRSSSSRRWP